MSLHRFNLRVFAHTIPVLFFIFLSEKIHAQQEVSDSLGYVFNDAIEQTVAANEDNPFDYDTEFEHLQDFLRNPLNINKALREDFYQLGLLSDGEIDLILAHRGKNDNYLTLLEMQGILGLETLMRILPFITVDDQLDAFQVPRNQWFKRGKYDYFARFERRLEVSEGYKKPDSLGGFLGSGNKLYTRFRYQFGKQVSYGFTLEKDAGEKGLDFWSAHFKLKIKHKVLKTIYLGDFAASLGQGLIHFNGFNLGKSSVVLSVEKKLEPLRVYTSSNEANFLRGVGFDLKLGRNTEGVLFLSHRARDGNIKQLPPDKFDSESVVTALQFIGLHRTDAEIDDKNTVSLSTIGARVKKNFGVVRWV